MSSFDNNSLRPNAGYRLTEAVEQLADLFQQRGTSHALIGGIAVSMRARVRATKDVDLLLSVPQLELPGLLEAMLERGCQFDLLKAIRDWNEGGMLAIEWSNGIRVDL